MSSLIKLIIFVPQATSPAGLPTCTRHELTNHARVDPWTRTRFLAALSSHMPTIQWVVRQSVNESRSSSSTTDYKITSNQR